MKNLFRLLLVAFATFLFGCMPSGDETVILPELRNSGKGTFVEDEFVPSGETKVIKSVQFISNSDNKDVGVLVVASSKLLDELYLYVEGKPGYFVLPLSVKDIKISDPKNNSYVYSVVLDSFPYDDQTEVSAKTTESDVSYGQETKYESMDKGLSCGMSASGGEAGWIGNIAMGQSNSSFVFEYNTYRIPDRIIIYDGNNIKGKKIFTYQGGTNELKNTTVRFNQPVIL